MILFIDAIHTNEIVSSQLAMLKSRLSPRALVFIDDINFSDDMRVCWKKLSTSDEVLASIEVNGRVGILEFNFYDVGKSK